MRMCTRSWPPALQLTPSSLMQTAQTRQNQHHMILLSDGQWRQRTSAGNSPYTFNLELFITKAGSPCLSLGQVLGSWEHVRNLFTKSFKGDLIHKVAQWLINTSTGGQLLCHTLGVQTCCLPLTPSDKSCLSSVLNKSLF